MDTTTHEGSNINGTGGQTCEHPQTSQSGTGHTPFPEPIAATCCKERALTAGNVIESRNPERKPTMSIERGPNTPSNLSDNAILKDTSTQPPTASCTLNTRSHERNFVSETLELVTSADVTKKSVWRKANRGKEWLTKHNSQEYVPCMRNKDTNYRLTAIDNPARQESCQAATVKQWDTVIRQAKEADMVPNAAKLAKFYRLGFTTGNPCLMAGLGGIPRLKKMFQRVLDEKDLDGIVSKLPFPPRNFTQAKYQKNLGSEKAKGVKQFLEEPDVVDAKTPINSKMKRLPPQAVEQSDPYPKVPQPPHVHKFIGPWSADEHLNDSEWVRGEGIVPINRKYSTPSGNNIPIEDEPAELSPDNYACQDHELPLVKHLDAEKYINLQGRENSDTSVLLTGSLVLKWMGKTDRTFRIVADGNEISRVSFRDIIATKYHIKPDKLWISYYDASCRDQEQLLLEVSPNHHDEFLVVKHCCYSLNKSQKVACDAESAEFFADNAKRLLKSLKNRKKPISQDASHPMGKEHSTATNTTQATHRKSSSKGSKGKKATQVSFEDSTMIRPFKKVGDKGSTSKLSTPAVPNNPQDPEARNSTSAKPPKIAHGIQNQDQSQENSECKKISSPGSIAGKEKHDMMVGINHPTATTVDISRGPFYARVSDTTPCIPVQLNDLVVRKRAMEKMMEDGKRDKWDIFDGPWEIIKFDSRPKTYAFDLGDNDSAAVGSQSDTLSKAQWEKMLSTKVILKYPPTAVVKPKKEEIGRLLPLTHIESIISGETYAAEIHAINLTVFEHPKFKRAEMIVNRSMQPQNLDDAPIESEIHGNDALFVVEVEKDIFVAVINICFQSIDGKAWEVEKLRGKRLRIVNINDPKVKGVDFEADPWVQRLKIAHPESIKNRGVYIQYKVHWAGWPDENDTWEGLDQIPLPFIRDYNMICDPYRNDPVDKLLPIEDLVFYDNEKKVEAKPMRTMGGKKRGREERGAEEEIASHIKNNSDMQQVNNKARVIEDLSDNQKCHGKHLKGTDTTPKIGKRVRRTSVRFKRWNSLVCLEREGNNGGNDEDVEMEEADEV